MYFLSLNYIVSRTSMSQNCWMGLKYGFVLTLFTGNSDQSIKSVTYRICNLMFGTLSSIVIMSGFYGVPKVWFAWTIGSTVLQWLREQISKIHCLISQGPSFLIWKVEMIQGILISRQWEKGLEQSMAHIVMLIIIIIIKKLKASTNRDARIAWR